MHKVNFGSEIPIEGKCNSDPHQVDLQREQLEVINITPSDRK
jgi:hypothetical protein